MSAGLLAMDYWPRLLCLCLAGGAAVYAAAAATTLLAAPAQLRRIARLQQGAPKWAAAQALALRLLPLAAAATVVLGLCLPSYMWLEPHHGAEQVGWWFCGLALGGALLLARGLWGSARAVLGGWRYARLARRHGERRRLGRDWVRVVAAPLPSMAVSGTLRPLLTVSRRAMNGLTAAQIEAGLDHERAHLRARDNLKRMLLLATPLPGARARSLERCWGRLAEWIADDRAAAGDADRSLTLASTLVAVARLAPPACPRLARYCSTLERGAGQELAERVRRLLSNEGAQAQPIGLRRWWAAGLALALVAVALRPATLAAVHTVLERFVH